jgi:putative nucleotidyltransferase with HDIG domain
MNCLDLDLPWRSPDALLAYPEFAALQTTRQDPVFHTEGDVWSHTLAAMEALKAMPAWQALDPVDQFITYAAILLHDIGKPATTRADEDGRIRSPGHAAAGAKIARSLLYREGVPFALREAICGLVRWHGLPPRIMDRANPEREAIHIVYLEAPWREILRRNQTRAASVPEKVMQKLLRNLEVPDASEAHQVTHLVEP